MFESSYVIVDAFASEPFGGNPAAIVLDARGLDDAQMQRIAAEFNLSETTFLLPPSKLIRAQNGADVRFRWFTPKAEVDLCGHATIAGIHALVNVPREIRIETRSGILQARVESIPGPGGHNMIWLELPTPDFGPCAAPLDELAPLLGISPHSLDATIPPIRTRDEDWVIFVDSFVTLNDIRPDFRRLSDFLCSHILRGLCVSTCRTVTPSIHVQSRFFVPHLGIDEDPVTGSVHGPLAAYLASQGRLPRDGPRAAATCSQGIPGGRTGLIQVLVERTHEKVTVRIGGRAVTVMRGQLQLSQEI